MPKRKRQVPVAVVILNWNGLELSRACLRSWRQADPAPSRILLVDNGSADGSAVKLRRAFPEAEILALPQNLGYAAGNNRGFERLWARGPKVEGVFICNNDTEVEPKMLGTLWQALQRHPRWGAVGPRILFHEGGRIWFEGGRIRPFSGRSKHLRYGAPDDAPGPAFTLGPADFVTGCGLLVRSPLLQGLGGFDEALWSYAEDSDLCFRLRKQGWESGIEPRARMTHKVSASFGLGSPLSLYYGTRNSWALLQRHRHFAWPFNLGGFVAANLAKAALEALRGRPQAAAAIIRGMAHGMLGRRGLDSSQTVSVGGGS